MIFAVPKHWAHQSHHCTIPKGQFPRLVTLPNWAAHPLPRAIKNYLLFILCFVPSQALLGHPIWVLQVGVGTLPAALGAGLWDVASCPRTQKSRIVFAPLSTVSCPFRDIPGAYVPLDSHCFCPVWCPFDDTRLTPRRPKIANSIRPFARIPLSFRGLHRYVYTSQIPPVSSRLVHFRRLSPPPPPPENCE